MPRLISLVENQPNIAIQILEKVIPKSIPVIGITGPPGAGKSTLLSGTIKYLRSLGKKIAVLAVDPSSPFSKGSLLGDRIRMQNHALDRDVFIRSLSSRGILGGLSAATSEVLALLQGFNFDYIFIETVGVGQSEIEIMGMASCVAVVLVPESGDEIQTIKSGLIEIADILVVNKSDRDGANKLFGILQGMLHEKENTQTGLVKTSAEKGIGIAEFFETCEKQIRNISKQKRAFQLANRIYQILANKRMLDFDRELIEKKILKFMDEPGFNLYQFINQITPFLLIMFLYS